ncbi:hypothetical protein C3L33_21766, partial [Rhododendron williamsianum]
TCTTHKGSLANGLRLFGVQLIDMSSSSSSSSLSSTNSISMKMKKSLSMDWLLSASSTPSPPPPSSFASNSQVSMNGDSNKKPNGKEKLALQSHASSISLGFWQKKQACRATYQPSIPVWLHGSCESQYYIANSSLAKSSVHSVAHDLELTLAASRPMNPSQYSCTFGLSY